MGCMSKCGWCLALIVLLVSFCAVKFKETRSPEAIKQHVMFEFQTFDVNVDFKSNDLDRFFALDLPVGYDKERTKSYPILVIIQGRESSHHDSKMMFGPKYLKQAQESGYIIAYAAYYKELASASLNAGSCCEPAIKEGIDDVQYFKDLIHKVAHEYNGNSQNVFLTGLSNGGIMTSRLACELADSHDIKLSAIAPVISSVAHIKHQEKCESDSWMRIILWNFYNIGIPVPIPTWNYENCPYEEFIHHQSHFSCDKLKDIPVITINGRKDQLVPYEGVTVTKKDEKIYTPPTKFLHRYYKEKNGCSGDQVQTYFKADSNNAEDTSECFTYTNCRTKTWACVVNNGAHFWHTKTPERLTNDMNAIMWFMMGPYAKTFETSEIILEFFDEYLI